jgi:hypothetical protein
MVPLGVIEISGSLSPSGLMRAVLEKLSAPAFVAASALVGVATGAKKAAMATVPATAEATNGIGPGRCNSQPSFW